MEVYEFFKLYHARKCAPGMEPCSCEDCDLNEKCGEFFLGCPLPAAYVFKLKQQRNGRDKSNNEA